MNNYEEMAGILYDEYKKSDIPEHVMGQVKSFFYGMLVKDNIYKVNALHAFLVENGHTAENPYVYGDDDSGVWYEPAVKEYTKIVATTRYCSMADDNTHIFILDEIDVDYVKFLAVTAWPEEVLADSTPWGDHRDIKHPSIETFRNSDFKFGYSDGRDDHYCFKYETLTGCVKDAYWNERRILWALNTLTYDYDEIIKRRED